MNAAKPGEPGSAKKVGEHRFGLIVRSMGDGDAGAGSCIGERAEVVVAGAARRVFEIGSFFLGLLGDVRGRGMKFQFVLGGKAGDKLFVGVGSPSPQFVVEVHDAQNDPKLAAQLQQQEQ